MSIASVPATFVFTGDPQTQLFAFTIPAGTYTSASWGLSYVNRGYMVGPLTPKPITFECGGATHSSHQLAVVDSGSPMSVAVTSDQLSDINSAAGGAALGVNLALAYQAISENNPSWTVNAFTLTLVGTGTGGTPTTYTYTITPIPGVCYEQLTIQLLDGSGNAANVPAGQQQVFTVTDNNNGTFNPPNPEIIPAGQSSITVSYSNPLPGQYLITVTPGPGPLQTASPVPGPQTLSIVITCSTTTPAGCACNLTRATERDNIRRQLGVTPPVDQGNIIEGLEPSGDPYPNNSFINQCLYNAIRRLNTEAKFNTTINIPIVVPSVPSTALGPQFIPLTGIASSCLTGNAINSIRRLVYTDATMPGQPYRLDPTDFQYEDRMRSQMDGLPPSQPFSYYVVGYQLAIYPASANGGTISIYAGTSVPQFCSDSDTIAELPTDYQDAIEYIALELICATPTGRRNFGDETYLIYRGYAQEAIAKVAAWAHQGLAETEQKSWGYRSNRFPMGRTSNAWQRRR